MYLCKKNKIIRGNESQRVECSNVPEGSENFRIQYFFNASVFDISRVGGGPLRFKSIRQSIGGQEETIGF